MARRRRPPRPGAMAELPPLRLAGQILLLQALYYVGALVLMLFTALVAGVPFSLDLVLGWETLRGDTTQGWLFAFIWILNGGFCMAIAIILIIARSKLVLDFGLTIHGIHLMATLLYTRSIPRNMMWWFAVLSSAAACVGLGTWGSQYRELQPVFFGGGGAASGAATGGNSSSAPQQNGGPVEGAGDEEQGFSRGRGRGRGRDGAGTYEMVGIKGRDDDKAA